MINFDFLEKGLGVDQEKCHLVVSGHKHENIWAKIGQTKIRENCLIL